ncbi:conserved hypothetical protein [Methanocaldococcus infernus ME]|uniref:Uncharacterized protein n=1 Tax=Methanocaldococcus infernus (strain DSM 11812 / JCM 15783 / ME) TaxID=573063 RepID=D5VU91_METIM|nr:hypothetical protein [Methanocaldococcus infernus]ADG12703.1 conserved hypothetical protein [Methanocaldococcus infernus ME]
MAKKFILLSFLILLSIITVNASGNRIFITTSDNWVIIYNNNIYLYNGTLYNITPKYIVFFNKTYTSSEINEHYGYLFYIDSFYLANKTYFVCDAWDGCRIGKLDINNRKLYLYPWIPFGKYHSLKSNGKEALACFDNKEGMGAKPILIELKYNKSSKYGLTYKGDSFYGLNLELEEYLFKYVNHFKDYYTYDFELQPYTFDYNSKDKYWLIYVNGDYLVGYLKKDTSIKYVDNNISCFVKYNGTFYDFKNFNYLLSQIVYNKYGNQWIGVNKNKLYILDNNISIIKTINLNKSIYKVFPIDRNNIYLIYPKKAVVEILKIEKIRVKNNLSKEIVEKYKQYNKTPPLYITKYRETKIGEKVVDIKDLSNLESNNYEYRVKNYILGIEKINLKNDKVTEIDTDSLNPIEIEYNGKEFLLIGNDSSLYIFNNGTYKKIANLNEFDNKNIQNSNNKIIKGKFENIATNYYIYVVVMVIFIILGYILWKKSN